MKKKISAVVTGGDRRHREEEIGVSVQGSKHDRIVMLSFAEFERGEGRKPRRDESATLFGGKGVVPSALSDLPYAGKPTSSAPELTHAFLDEKCEAVSTEQITSEPSSGREGHIDILPSDTVEGQREFVRPNRRASVPSWLISFRLNDLLECLDLPADSVGGGLLQAAINEKQAAADAEAEAVVMRRGGSASS